MADTPTTTIFSLILALLGFFTAVTSATMFYHRRDSRRLRRLELAQQAAEGRGSTSLPPHWSERPVIWEVCADKHPKRTSNWEDSLVSYTFALWTPLFFRDYSTRIIPTASQHDVRSRSTLDPRAAASPVSGSTEQRRGVGIHQRCC